MGGFLNQIIFIFTASVRTENYYTLRKVGLLSRILCGVLVAVLAPLILFLTIGMQVCNSSEFKTGLEEIPEFSFINGELQFEEPYESDLETMYLYVDTDVYRFTLKDSSPQSLSEVGAKTILDQLSQKSNYRYIVLFSRTNAVVRNGWRTQVVSYRDLSGRLNVWVLDKELLQRRLTNWILKIMYWVSMVYMPLQLGLIFGVPLLYGLVGLIVGKIIKSDSSYADVYWIAFYMNLELVLLKSILEPWVPVPSVVLNGVGLILVTVQMIRTLVKEPPRVVSSYEYRSPYGGDNRASHGNEAGVGPMVDSNGNPLPWAHAYNMQYDNKQSRQTPDERNERI